MHITIAGSGNVGRALAGGWLKAGHRVTFATRDVADDKTGEEAFGYSDHSGYSSNSVNRTVKL